MRHFVLMMTLLIFLFPVFFLHTTRSQEITIEQAASTEPVLTDHPLYTEKNYGITGVSVLSLPASAFSQITSQHSGALAEG